MPPFISNLSHMEMVVNGNGSTGYRLSIQLATATQYQYSYRTVKENHCSESISRRPVCSAVILNRQLLIPPSYIFNYNTSYSQHTKLWFRRPYTLTSRIQTGLFSKFNFNLKNNLIFLTIASLFRKSLSFSHGFHACLPLVSPAFTHPFIEP